MKPSTQGKSTGAKHTDDECKEWSLNFPHLSKDWLVSCHIRSVILGPTHRYMGIILPMTKSQIICIHYETKLNHQCTYVSLYRECLTNFNSPCYLFTDLRNGMTLKVNAITRLLYNELLLLCNYCYLNVFFFIFLQEFIQCTFNAFCELVALNLYHSDWTALKLLHN